MGGLSLLDQVNGLLKHHETASAPPPKDQPKPPKERVATRLTPRVTINLAQQNIAYRAMLERIAKELQAEPGLTFRSCEFRERFGLSGTQSHKLLTAYREAGWLLMFHSGRYVRYEVQEKLT